MRITFVGLSGVPFLKRAIDVRLNATIQLFLDLGYDVDVVNRFTVVKDDITNEKFNLINPYSQSANVGKFKFLCLYILALLYEPIRLISMNRKKHIDVLFVNSGHFADMFIYWIISRIIGAKIVYQYCEYRAAFETSNPYHKLNGYLISKYGAKLWDGAICITTFLEEDCKRKNPKMQTLKMYPICNFNEFGNVNPFNPDYKYVMFCGSVEYKEVVDLIIDSYNNSKIKETHKLLLVLRGSDAEIRKIKTQNSHFVIKTNLSYTDLIAHYKGAKALLIPLRDSVRDIARFPNKVCEYCAAATIVITTNNGEMKYLFEDNKNAFVAAEFSVESFSQSLDKLLDCKDYSELGKKSYALGLELFNIEAYRESTKSFIESVVQN